VARPGDFLCGTLGDARYLLVRGQDGTLRAFHNVSALCAACCVLCSAVCCVLCAAVLCSAVCLAACAPVFTGRPPWPRAHRRCAGTTQRQSRGATATRPVRALSARTTAGHTVNVCTCAGPCPAVVCCTRGVCAPHCRQPASRAFTVCVCVWVGGCGSRVCAAPHPHRRPGPPGEGHTPQGHPRFQGGRVWAAPHRSGHLGAAGVPAPAGRRRWRQQQQQ
jgi:hypothetical protein